MPGFLAFVSILFFNIQKREKQKIVLGFLEFVSILFFNIRRRNEQKNSAGFFRISKYAFLIFEKEISKRLY